jgi:hypothetical protein
LIYPTEYHIFLNAYDFFELKHDIFMEDYLYAPILGGDAPNSTPLLDVEIIQKKNENFNLNIKILNGILNSQPLISILHIDSNQSKYFFDIFYLNNYEEIEDFYCLKTSQNFPINELSLYQIMELKVKSLTMINDFWLTTKADILSW